MLSLNIGDYGAGAMPTNTTRRTLAVWCTSQEGRISGTMLRGSGASGKGQTMEHHEMVALTADWPPLSFTVAAVHPIARREPPDDVFQIVQTFPFGR